MDQIKRIAIDTSKSVFALHGVDHSERCVLRRKLKRDQLLAFFAALPPVVVVMEACGASHHWGRQLIKLGHTVRLIPPQYVKPFVKRSKNDDADAEAINEAAARPSMRYVPVKSAEQQAAAMALGLRDLAVRQRSQLVNALRGLAGEFGIVVAKGTQNIKKLLETIAAAEAVPARARQDLARLGARIGACDAEIAALDRQLMAQHKENAMSQLLEGIPGIGPITALNLALRTDARQFKSARHFAAWLGLTPKDHSSGGKQRLGAITRAGDERLRRLLVVGATAVVAASRPGKAGVSAWVLKLLERRPRKLVAVALANKMARIAWAMMTSGESYRKSRPVAA